MFISFSRSVFAVVLLFLTLLVSTGIVEARTKVPYEVDQAYEVVEAVQDGVKSLVVSGQELPSEISEDTISFWKQLIDFVIQRLNQPTTMISVPEKTKVYNIETGEVSVERKKVDYDEVYGFPVSGTRADLLGDKASYLAVPQISYWWGKVNQHVDLETGRWMTDPDGVSGANLDMLSYCQKWYPETVEVMQFIPRETITTWRERGNLNRYTSTRPTYKCLK